MAMKKQSVFAGIAILGIALLSYLAYSNDAERAIRRQINAFARDCEKKEGQGPIRSIKGAGDLSHYFSSNAYVQLGANYPFSPPPREIPALVARAHMALDSLKINISGLDFLPRTNRDVMETRVAAEAIMKRGTTEDRALDEFQIRWQKLDGKWLIESVRSDSTIQPIEL